jgi:hypothetical protein
MDMYDNILLVGKTFFPLFCLKDPLVPSSLTMERATILCKIWDLKN